MLPCTSFATRCPRAVLGASFNNGLLCKTPCRCFIKLHKNGSKCWFNYKGHQKEKCKETKCAKQHKEGSCVEQ